MTRQPPVRAEYQRDLAPLDGLPRAVGLPLATRLWSATAIGRAASTFGR